MPDGTLRSTTSVQPRWTHRADGWHGIDASLVREGSRWQPRFSDVAYSFSGDGSGSLAEIDRDGHSLTIEAPKLHLTAPLVTSTSITYSDAAPDVDLVFTAMPGGFDTAYVFKGPRALADDLTLTVGAPGLSDIADASGAQSYVDESGTEVFAGGTPLAYPLSNPMAARPISPAMRVRATAVSSVKALTVQASSLPTSSLSYPYVVDPSVSAAQDHFTLWSEKNPGTSYFDNASYGSNVGNYTGAAGDANRSGYQFEMPSDVFGGNVTQAYFTGQVTYAPTSAGQYSLELHNVASFGAGTTWNSQPADNGQVRDGGNPSGAVLVGGAGSYVWSLKDTAVQFAQGGGSVYRWFSLTPPGDRMESIQYGRIFNHNPTITVVYTKNSPPDTPSVPAVQITGKNTVNVATNVRDVDGGTLHTTFRICRADNGSSCLSDTGVDTNSGASSTVAAAGVTVPDGNWVASANTCDSASACSPFSNPASFAVSTLPDKPTTPAVAGAVNGILGTAVLRLDTNVHDSYGGALHTTFRVCSASNSSNCLADFADDTNNGTTSTVATGVAGDDVPEGSWVASAVTCDSGGGCSAWSDPASFTIPDDSGQPDHDGPPIAPDLLGATATAAPSSISGTVRTGSGSPVAGAKILVMADSDSGASFGRSGVIGQVVSAANGSYSFTMPPDSALPSPIAAQALAAGRILNVTAVTLGTASSGMTMDGAVTMGMSVPSAAPTQSASPTPSTSPARPKPTCGCSGGSCPQTVCINNVDTQGTKPAVAQRPAAAAAPAVTSAAPSPTSPAATAAALDITYVPAPESGTASGPPDGPDHTAPGADPSWTYGLNPAQQAPTTQAAATTSLRAVSRQPDSMDAAVDPYVSNGISYYDPPSIKSFCPDNYTYMPVSQSVDMTGYTWVTIGEENAYKDTQANYGFDVSNSTVVQGAISFGVGPAMVDLSGSRTITGGLGRTTPPIRAPFYQTLQAQANQAYVTTTFGCFMCPCTSSQPPDTNDRRTVTQFIVGKFTGQLRYGVTTLPWNGPGPQRVASRKGWTGMMDICGAAYNLHSTKGFVYTAGVSVFGIDISAQTGGAVEKRQNMTKGLGLSDKAGRPLCSAAAHYIWGDRGPIINNQTSDVPRIMYNA